MKSLIKRILPDMLIENYRKGKKLNEVNKGYEFDKKRLLKYAYGLKGSYSQANLRAKITFHYHAIEKGLSNPNLRLGFGERAFTELFWAMDEYIKKDYPTDDFRFQSALSVINAYIQLHNSKNYSVEIIEKHANKYAKYFFRENSDIGGFKTIKINELPNFAELNFKDLASNRHTVRDFGENPIQDCKIFEAIDIASKTPSVCNRQSWKVRYINSTDKVNDLLMLQGGLTGNGQNLSKLLVVTADKQYMNGGHERNQTYIDGGLFTMSLLYSLTSLSIASCTLNVNFDIKKEKKIRDMLSIDNSEDLIVFIAVGSYPDITKVAKSPRDNYKLITTIIN